MGIVWLASYPKSGNTWLRFVLYHLLYGPLDDSGQLNRRIPDMHRKAPYDPPESGPACAKTHLMLSPGHPMLNQSERAIYVMRNPRDVALSALNFRRMTGSLPDQAADADYLRAFIQAGGDPGWLQQRMGTWGQHVQSWTTTDRFPVLTLRYEAIKASPAAEFARVVEFLGLDAGAEQIEQAVAASSFESMRSLEVKEKERDQAGRLWVGDAEAGRKGRYFMNKGLTGQRLDDLARGLDAAFDTAFREALRAAGYETP